MPDAYWDPQAGLKTKELLGELNRLTAYEAAEKIKVNARPQAPDAYKIELPKDFRPPQGVEFAFKKDDPLLSQAQAWAHKRGLDQEAFSEALALYAGSRVADEQTVKTARDAEIAKLGTTATARIDAIGTYYRARLGQEAGQQMMARILTASDVEIHEKLISQSSSPHGSNFSQQHREPNEPARVDQAGWDKMTYSERKDYAAKFPARAAA